MAARTIRICVHAVAGGMRDQRGGGIGAFENREGDAPLFEIEVGAPFRSATSRCTWRCSPSSSVLWSMPMRAVLMMLTQETRASGVIVSIRRTARRK